MSTRFPSDTSRHAFSLVELLVVIAIIGIIGAFAVPATGQLLKGSALTQAANIFTDQTSAARQQALTRNRSVEVRFYKFLDPEQVGETTPQFRALQYLEIADGGIPTPTGRYVRLPNTVVMNPDPTLSTVLSDTPISPTSNDPDLPRGVGRNYTYVAFRFQPDGATSLTATSLWYITVHLLNDLGRASANKPPPNFFTWMIDPVSGSSKVLRPGVK
jgi:uncharacterized protein (TIGR02596 family)